jgi:hypothetical protein
MDIWEDSMSIALFISGHLEVKLDDTANMERAKKRMMRYHWSEDTLFFQNLVVPRPIERRMLIKKIHEEIGYLGTMRTLTKQKKGSFGMTELRLSKNSLGLVKSVN